MAYLYYGSYGTKSGDTKAEDVLVRSAIHQVTGTLFMMRHYQRPAPMAMTPVEAMVALEGNRPLDRIKGIGGRPKCVYSEEDRERLIAIYLDDTTLTVASAAKKAGMGKHAASKILHKAGVMRNKR